MTSSNTNDYPLHDACRKGNCETVQSLLELMEMNLSTKVRDHLIVRLLQHVPRREVKRIVNDMSKQQIIDRMKENENWSDYGGIDQIFQQEKNGTTIFNSRMINAVHPETGLTPLMEACVNGNYYITYEKRVEIVRTLIKKGANVNQPSSNGFGWTALDYHVRSFNFPLPIVRLLLEQYLNINRKDYLGDTALHAIAKIAKIAKKQLDLSREGDVFELIFYLIQKGANILIKNQDGKTPLHLMLENRSDDDSMNQFLGRLQKEFGRNNTDWNHHQHVSFIEIVNHADVNGITLLHNACGMQNIELVRSLVAQYGANINVFDNDHWTPLCHAILPRYLMCSTPEECQERLDMIQYLLERGAIVNVDTTTSSLPAASPLHLAISYDDFEVTKLLLQHGADKNRPSLYFDMFTPLHVACGRKALDIVQLLIHGSQDMDSASRKRKRQLNGHGGCRIVNPVPDNVNWTTQQQQQYKLLPQPIEIAAQQGSRDIVFLLLQEGALFLM